MFRQCISCNREVFEGIHNELFYGRLFMMLSSFIVLALFVLLLTWLSGIHFRARTRFRPEKTVVPFAASALVLGMGMGGFIDGIVFHQLLQLHAMFSHVLVPDTVAAKSINMFWDVIFHLFTFFTVMLGIILLWKNTKRTDVAPSGYVLAGGMIGGWCLFNFIEGLINHYLLRIHVVNEYSPKSEYWNHGFIVLSVLLVWPSLKLILYGRDLENSQANKKTGS